MAESSSGGGQTAKEDLRLPGMAKTSSDSDSDSSDSSSEESEDKKKKNKKKKKKDKKKESKGKSSKKKKDKSKKKKKKDKKEKDPYSKNAQEKARLEAQQRLMGLTPGKSKKKKKKKGKSSSSSSSEEQVDRLREQVEDTTTLREQQHSAKEKAATAEPEKPVHEMTWPERAAAAACKAENEAIWRGASKDEAVQAAEEAGEAVMRRAVQFGYMEPAKRARFDAAKPTQKPKMSPVEQARSAGLHPVAFSGGGGPTFRGGGHFGMTAPKMTGGMEGGYMG